MTRRLRQCHRLSVTPDEHRTSTWAWAWAWVAHTVEIYEVRSNSMTVDAQTWITRYSEILGVTPPSDEEIEALLALAGVAAHASERTAAPVSCWVAAKANKSAEEALRAAERLASSLQQA
jgi:hypothetical protein